MLREINNYFGNIGIISLEKSSNAYRLRFIGIANCLIVKSHFDKYSLFTYKLVHYQIWSKVLNIFANKEHLTIDGLNKIVALNQHSPKGISPELLEQFPNFLPVLSPAFAPDFSKMTIDWIAGFMTADGSFGLIIVKANTKLF